MTDTVNPSQNRAASSFLTAGTIAYNSGITDGYLVPSGDSPTSLADDQGLNGSNLIGFNETSSGTSLDVTIGGGEAFVFGSYVARDTDTTITLAPSTNNQTVYIGWDKDLSDTVLIGRSQAFGADDPKIPLYTYYTDGSGVTSVDDERSVGRAADSNVSTTSSDLTTSGEDLIFVDTSSNTVTITLASSDVDSGNNVFILDSGGNAGTNSITLATEGSETIDGNATKLIEEDYSAAAVASDGTNWYTSGSAGGGVTIEDDGSIVVDPTTAVNFGTDLSVTDDGDGTVTVDSTVDSTITVQDDGTNISTAVDTLDFAGSDDFTLTNPTTGEASIAFTNDSLTITSGTGLSGGGTIALGGSTTLDVSPTDDEEIPFGSGDNITLRYDATNDELRFQDNTNGTDKMALDRTTGDLTISGQLIEGTSL